MSEAPLLSLVLMLEATAPAALPRNLGRASHALFLRLIDGVDPALAAALHDGAGPRPFTCSNVLGGRARGDTRHVAPGAPLWLRYTGLSPEVCARLGRLAQAPPETVELDGPTARVVRATTDGEDHPWAGRSDYRALLERARAWAASRGRRVTLEFASPTTFRSQGVNVPLPLPGYVFGSLLDRWQAHAPVALDDEVRRYAEEMLAISCYRLQTRRFATKGGGRQVGYVGEVTYVALNTDRYWLAAFGALSEYAFFAGVGAMASVGIGQVRRVSR